MQYPGLSIISAAYWPITFPQLVLIRGVRVWVYMDIKKHTVENN